MKKTFNFLNFRKVAEMLEKFGDTNFSSKSVERNATFRDVSPETLNVQRDRISEEAGMTNEDKIEIIEDTLTDLDSSNVENQEIEEETSEILKSLDNLAIPVQISSQRFNIPRINVEFEDEINELPQTPVNSPEVTSRNFESVIIGES